MEITRETLISEIIDNCPQAFPVFQEIGMHCMGCALASGETLEQACAAHGVESALPTLVRITAFCRCIWRGMATPGIYTHRI